MPKTATVKIDEYGRALVKTDDGTVLLFSNKARATIWAKAQGYTLREATTDADPHEVMDIEQKIGRLKLRARGAASVNDYAHANALESEIRELTEQLAAMKGPTDMSDCSCTKDCAGTKDCDCGCQGTKDAMSGLSLAQLKSSLADLEEEKDDAKREGHRSRLENLRRDIEEVKAEIAKRGTKDADYKGFNIIPEGGKFSVKNVMGGRQSVHATEAEARAEIDRINASRTRDAAPRRGKNIHIHIHK